MKDHVEGIKTEDLAIPALLSTLIESKRFLDEYESFTIFTDIGLCLSALHQSGSCHSQVSSKTIEVVCSNGKTSSRLLSLLEVNQNQDHLIYESPEVLNGSKQSSKSDIWSLGVVLFEMLHGYPPFQGKSPRLLMRNILQRGYSFSSSLSNSVKKLICDLLIEDPVRRPCLKEIFQYQWIQDYCQTKLKKHWQVSHDDFGNGNIVDVIGMIVIVQFEHREKEMIENELIQKSMIVDENGNIFVNNSQIETKKADENKSSLGSRLKLKPAIRSAGSSRANSPSVRFDLNLKVYGDETKIKSQTNRQSRPPKIPAKEETKVNLKPRREMRKDYEGIILSPCESPVYTRRVSAPRSRFLQNFRDNYSKS